MEDQAGAHLQQFAGSVIDKNREPSVPTCMYTKSTARDVHLSLYHPTTHHTYPPYPLHVHKLHGPVGLSPLQSDQHNWHGGGLSHHLARLRETRLTVNKYWPSGRQSHHGYV